MPTDSRLSLLSDMPWLEQPWQRLSQQLAQNRLPHGLLLHGPVGAGLESFVDAFSASLMCERNGAGEPPCGECPSCQMLDAGTHSDRLRVHCAEDKREIPVDALRQLSEKLTLGRQRAAWRVVTVYPAERLSRAAANAFLKTLEEPAADNLLILVSHDPARLLPTLRSRIQSHAIALPPHEHALAWLRRRHEHIGEAHLALALLASQGAPVAADQMLQDQNVAAFSDVRDDLLKLMSGSCVVTQLGQAWSDNLPERLQWAATWSHAWLRAALGQSRLPTQALGEKLPRCEPSWLQERYQDAISMLRLARTPTNPQLLAEKFLLGWCQR